ncbi:MAG TPA: ATP-binding cassette domain-containing protein, partial [Dongiaceae bacterium]
MGAPLVELKGVSKYFGTVVALNEVSIDVGPGEVHCLLGDNGAGKSTLIKVLSGAHQPDRGAMLVNGIEQRFSS